MKIKKGLLLMAMIAQTVTSEKESVGAGILYGAGTLGKGRSPFAGVDIYGMGANRGVRGRADFYYTPLGMLICVSVKGLAGENGVYCLSFVSADERSEEVGMKCVIPPLYERNGYAWCSALTGKVSPSEIFGKRVVMRSLRRGYEKVEVASGVVRSFGA